MELSVPAQKHGELAGITGYVAIAQRLRAGAAMVHLGLANSRLHHAKLIEKGDGWNAP
jgi:hypothetical protein